MEQGLFNVPSDQRRTRCGFLVPPQERVRITLAELRNADSEGASRYLRNRW